MCRYSLRNQFKMERQSLPWACARAWRSWWGLVLMVFGLGWGSAWGWRR